MSDSLTDPTIVVPVNAADPAEPPPGLVELLHPLHIVVLGYYPVPDQVAPEQLREEYEDEATAATERVSSRFVDRGGDVTSLVVFTRDLETTIDRVAADHDADAILTAGSMGDALERILVPLKGDPNLERIVSFVGDLVSNSDAHVQLLHIADSDEDESHGEFLLRGVADRLTDDGLDPDRVTWTQERSATPSASIVTTAAEADLVVVGESRPTLRDRILGAVTSEVVEASEHPVLVVRGG